MRRVCAFPHSTPAISPPCRGHRHTLTEVFVADEAAWKAEAVTRWGEMVELASPESWQALKTELEKKRGQLNKKKVT